jgi:hypothetical protein
MTADQWGSGLFDQHRQLLIDRAVTPDVARARGYRSVDTKKLLDGIDIAKSHQRTPGLLIPVYGPEAADGQASTWQYRPDNPKLNAKGNPVKYVTARRGMVIDVPPATRPHIVDPARPLWITEGIFKVDAGVTAGLDMIGLLGVWNWRGTNSLGGKTVLADWEAIALNDREVFVAFDHDVMVNSKVRTALNRLCGFLEKRGAQVGLAMLPDVGDGKSGLDDYLADGGTVADLEADDRIINPGDLKAYIGEAPAAAPAAPAYQPAPVALADGLATFHKWLHLDDDDAIIATAAAVVGNLAPGDPCWLLLVAPPSSAKTEIVQSILPLNYVHLVSTVTESALLSGTSMKERAADATGGLLRQVGAFGIICFKDFTSTLSQNKDTAKQALAALREVYDGAWSRPVGSDGGKLLRWDGKCGLVGAVTPSIDRYGQVVNSLGDRYLLLRLDSVDDPSKVVDAALWHDSDPGEMRRALADAMCGIIAAADLDIVTRKLTDDERSALTNLAIYAARARTTVERDGYTGDLLVVPQPEGPGRLALAFKRMYGGMEAIGVDVDVRWRVLRRLAADCVPSVRTVLVQHLVTLDTPAKTDVIAEAVGMVKRTAERHLEDLALLDLVSRRRDGENANSPVVWSPTAWLREFVPSATDNYPPSPNPSVRGVENSTESASRSNGSGDPSYPSVAPSDYVADLLGEP